MIIKLNGEELETLDQQDPEKVAGGFQGYIVDLQNRVNRETNELDLTDDDVEKIKRYAGYFEKRGGWERRFQSIFRRTLGADVADDS
jgi:hypothetical protein